MRLRKVKRIARDDDITIKRLNLELLITDKLSLVRGKWLWGVVLQKGVEKGRSLENMILFRNNFCLIQEL